MDDSKRNYQKKGIGGIILLLLIWGLITPVLASDNVTISFNDLNLIARQDLEIYGYNDTASHWDLLAVQNTSSHGLLFQPGTYNIIIRGSAISRITNPVTMFMDAVTFFETYWFQIFLIMAVVVFVARKW